MPVPVFAILKGILLGLGAAVPIGPVNVQIARRTLRDGFSHGVALGAGAVTVDITYAILSTLGFQALGNRRTVMIPLTIAGALLLGYLGIMSLFAARRMLRDNPLETTSKPEASASGAYTTGLL